MAYISFKPSDFFNTVLYTGTGGTQSITGVGFQPDWVWLKDRSLTYDHQLHDSSRSASAGYLASNNTNAENSTYPLSSFDSDGWTTVSGGTPGQNASSDSFVSWNWLANGGTTSSNTDGSITSTVQVNSTSKFSIGTFTSDGGTSTIGHGLGVTPDFYMIKTRSISNGWYVYTTAIDGSLDFLSLETTAAKSDSGLSSPSSTVFSVNSSVQGANGTTCVFYAFKSIKGYSKFGTYTGNGSSNGTYVYTGFRPAFVLTKRTNAVGSWVVQDNKRPSYNQGGNYVYASSTNVEATDLPIDILSNGFKQRQGTYADTNGSGSTYLYIAFAEFPLVGSNGIPGTAR